MLKYDVFMGKDLQEAIQKMKYSLGPDAMILKQRVVNTRGLLGLFKKPMVEVVGFKSDKMNLLKKDNTEFYRSRLDSPTPTSTTGPEEVTLQKELADIKKTLEVILKKENPTFIQDQEISTEEDKVWNKYIQLLKRNGLGDELIDKTIEALKKDMDNVNLEDENIIREKLKDKLKELIEIEDPIKGKNKLPRIFMFVGPTGVGKTTSLVKLAANYKLKEDREIEIFTLDNYRIAATEQLKTYSDIMQIPFKKFDNKIDLKNALKKSKADIILLDTAGRSPKDDMSISALKDFIKTVNFYSIDIFLVVSASTKKDDILSIHEKYSKLNYKYLLITKLDETETLGSLIDSMFYIKKPLTYVAFGQDVPKHISMANVELLVDTILNKES